ncbi:MAG: hydroxymethylbilane synthase [Candidatus Brocadiia bacterium]
MEACVIGTRGSPLAMWQADYVRRALIQAHAGLEVRIEIIRTTGDVLLEPPLARIGGMGVFTKEIENALLKRQVDLAVHSLKDLPTQLADGLRLAAVLKREDPADALVARDGRGLAQLPAGAKVLTGSLRRQAQLMHRRPDLKIAQMRGNVQTRLDKFDRSDASAMLLACAGLARLNLSGRITQRLDPAEFLPACGQGALAVEVRADDSRVAELCGALDDRATRLATTAERAFLAALGGGCLAPIGAYGRSPNGEEKLVLTGMVARLDGSRLIQQTVAGAAREPDGAVALGERLAERLRAEGAEEILREIASKSATTLREGP